MDPYIQFIHPRLCLTYDIFLHSQLVYQSTVFISRSSISLGMPPLPERLLSFPAIVQFVILLTLVYESAVGIFSEDHPASSIMFVFLLISIEGICGGLA